jgi:hypothetical protein
MGSDLMKTETLLIVALAGAYFLSQAKKAQASEVTAPVSQPVTATPGANPGEIILMIADRVWGTASGFIPWGDSAPSSSSTPNSATNYSSDDAWPSNIA